jgi:hypothetical protein
LIRAYDFAWFEFVERSVDDLDVTQNVTASPWRGSTLANFAGVQIHPGRKLIV